MVEFLRDYPNVFPVVVAVLNGALAAISANYPFKSARRKMIFIAVVLSLSLSAVAAAICSQRLINAQKLEERAWWGAVREQLGTFLGQGNALMQKCHNESVAPPQQEVGVWTMGIDEYLASVLGQSYAARFRSDAGLPLTATAISSPAHRTLWYAIFFRVARLEQFSEELPR